MNRLARFFLLFSFLHLLSSFVHLPLLLSSVSAQTPSNPVFAPYVDCCLWPPYDISRTDSTGICYYTMAFIVDDPSQPGPNPCWGGYSVYDMTWYQSQIAGLRANGGEIIISCGGASGTELAYVAADPSELKNAYQLVVAAYELQSIDFDIEGMMVADTASVHRRSLALKLLQDDNPGLEVSLTLPVMPFGLTLDGLNVVMSAVENGVDLGVINIMAMDYGGVGDMGDWAMEAADNLFLQLKSIYLQAGITIPDSLIRKKVGITPMIGQNDVPGEIFYLDDAQDLRNYALLHQIGRVSMWSANRDRQCVNSWDPLYICSHIPQDTFEFTQTFLTGGVMDYCEQYCILQDIMVQNGQTSCYDAMQTITVAGNGTQFTVLSGGSVSLIAGRNIQLLPGTTIQAGGYLSGSITTSGQYCFPLNPSSPGSCAHLVVATNDDDRAPKQDFQVRLYPNPASGDFSVQVLSDNPSEMVRLRIFDLLGRELLSARFPMNQKKDLSLSDYPSGIYLVEVRTDKEICRRNLILN